MPDGTPQRRVPYGRTVHGEDEIAAVTHVLRTSTQMGKHVHEFEKRVAGQFDKANSWACTKARKSSPLR